MASLVLAMALCVLLIFGGCSDSSNDGGSAGKLVNSELSKEYTVQEVADAIKGGFSNIKGIDVSQMIATSNAVKAYSGADRYRGLLLAVFSKMMLETYE